MSISDTYLFVLKLVGWTVILLFLLVIIIPTYPLMIIAWAGMRVIDGTDLTFMEFTRIWLTLDWL